MSRISIYMEFSEALDEVFFTRLDNCFEHLGYSSGNCEVHSGKDSGWIDVAWNERASNASKLPLLKCKYLYSSKSDWDTIWILIQCQTQPFHHMAINTSHDFGYNNSFTNDEKEQALRIEALSLELHKALNANDTAAWSDYHLSEGGGNHGFIFQKMSGNHLVNCPSKKVALDFQPINYERASDPGFD
jgi:hypothetical protein